MKNKLDFVIAVRDRENTRIQRCINSFKEYANKIYVVDYNSKKPVKIKYAEIIRCNEPVWNKSHALNLGIKKCESNYICTVDCDMMLNKKLLDLIIKNLNKETLIFNTNVRRIKLKDISEDYDEMLSKSEVWFEKKSRGNIYSSANGGIQVLPREWINKVGGYDEGLGLYWGAMDNRVYEQAKSLGMTIVDLNIPMLHQQHKNEKESNLDKKEQLFAQKVRRFKAGYLNELICKGEFISYMSWGDKKPNHDWMIKLVKEWSKNILIERDYSKQKPKVYISIVTNYNLLPTYFALDLIKIIGRAKHSGIDILLNNPKGVGVDSIRNNSVLEAINCGATHLLQLDSVTPETPLLIKRNGLLDFVEIQELFDNNKNNRNWTNGLNGEKIYSHISKNIEIYTKNGWKKINHVMKHHVKKPIYHLSGEYVTRTTGDHSLFKDKKQIKPSELKIGDEIDTIEFKNDKNHSSITKGIAEFYGFFCAEGTCGYRKSSKIKGVQKYNYQWNISGQDKQLLESYIDVLEGLWCRKFKIEKNSIKDGKICYRLVPNGKRKDITEFFRQECYTKSGYKKIPQVILNSNKEIIEAFLEGYIKGDGHIYKDGSKQYSTNSYILSTGLNYLYNLLGKNTMHYIRKDKPTIITTKVNKTNRKLKRGITNKIVYNDYEGDVYDICTDDGTFVGGVGNVLFKNTDHLYSEDIILRLLEHDKDFVCGITSKRNNPYTQTQFKDAGLELVGVKENICKFRGDEGLIKIGATGMVGSLIKTSLFKKINFPYYKTEYKMKENKIHETGEDIFFCRQLLKANIDLWCDTSLSYPHQVNNAFVDKGKMSIII